MESIRKLCREVRLRNTQDIAARLVRMAQAATGSLVRRLPAQELTTTEFLQKLHADVATDINAFLDEHNGQPLPWKDIPAEMISDDLIAHADKIVDQKFHFLSGQFYFHGQIDWHHALDKNVSWPYLHWSEINYRAMKDIGDIKPCWEMNRHQFFPVLALAFRKTGNIKYTAALQRFIHGWCDQNTPETGIHYISGLEIGLRCISWIFTEKILRGTHALDKDAQERLHRNIWPQARHLSEYLSYTEKTGRNNHLLGEAASLAYIALSYPEFTDSNKWLEQSLYALWPAFDAQVTPDGMHFECSFSYHLFIAEFIMILFSEMKHQRRPMPAKCLVLAEKISGVISRMRMPDGNLPNINDSDDGFAFPLPLPVKERASCYLSAAATLFGRPDFKSAAQTPYNLYAFMLFGDNGDMDYRVITDYAFTPSAAVILKNSGLAALRNGDGNFALIKNNPDPFPKSGHNHADLLSVLMTIGGKEILVDAGTFRYSADHGFRNALRSTAAHNTVTVDNKGQAEPHRNFGWLEKTQAGGLHSQEEKEFRLIDADHESYSDVRHRRVLIALENPAAYIIIDRLSGENAHHFEQFWHFPHDTRLEDAGQHHYRLQGPEGLRAHIRFFREDSNDQHDIIYGSDRNKWSYVSKSYGTIESSMTLRHSWSSDLTPEHATHRITIFCKDAITLEVKDLSHGVFHIGDYTFDLNVTPVVVTRR